jgi:hypothetical protein
MNRSRLFRRFGAFCMATLLAISTHAFEGKVDMKITTDSKKDAEMMTSYRIKGPLMRIELASAPGMADSGKKKRRPSEEAMGATIIDSEKKEMIMIMHSEKKYMVHSISNDTGNRADSDEGKIDFKPTGRKEKIAGLEAEEYISKADGQITESWMTKELGKMVMAAQERGGKAQAKKDWAAFAEAQNAFPLRVIQRKKEGGPITFKMEVVSIDRSKQPAELFAPPAGYTQFEMPKMPGLGDMMKGMIPGR